jgi:myosin heavy subunit
MLQERIKNQEEGEAALGEQRVQNEELKTKVDNLEAALKEKEEYVKSDNFIKRCKVNLKQIDENILNKADIELLKVPKHTKVTEERILALEEELNSEREQKQIFEKEAYENISKVATLERKLNQEIQLRKDVAAELSKNKDSNKGPGYKLVVELKAELSETKKKIQDLTQFNNDQKQIIEALEKNSTVALQKAKEDLEMASKGTNMLKEEKEVLNSALSKAKEEMDKSRKSLEHLKEMEKQKASLTAEATELKKRCKTLENDKESLSKLNAKVEQEKQQLKQETETKKGSDNCSEDRYANLEKMYKDEVRSK